MNSLATVLLTLTDGVCGFSFLNHVGRHIMAIFQDYNVKIHQAQIVKEWLRGSVKNHFHTWIGTSWVQTLNSLKVFGMFWRRLNRVLDSCIVNTRSWPKFDAPLNGNNIPTFISIKKCTNFRLLSIYLYKSKQWLLFWPWSVVYKYNTRYTENQSLGEWFCRNNNVTKITSCAAGFCKGIQYI